MGLVVISLLVTLFLVFNGIFLFYRKYKSGTNPLKNPYFWITSIVATPIIYAGFLFTWFLISSAYELKEFDKVNWAEQEDSR